MLDRHEYLVETKYYNLIVKQDIQNLWIFLMDGTTHEADDFYFDWVLGLNLQHFASGQGYFEVVKCLVEDFEITIELLSFSGDSFLEYAYDGRHYHILQYLLERVVDENLIVFYEKYFKYYEQGPKSGVDFSGRKLKIRKR